jgi:hypothetical protein
MSESWQDHVMAEPPERPLRNVPILRTVGQALSMMFGNLGSLLRAAAFPALLSLLIGLGQWYFLPEEMRGLLLEETASLRGAEVEFQQFHWSQTLGILSLIPYVLFAVAWHRVLLMGPKAGRPALLPAWKPRHWAFLGYLVVTTVIFLAAMIVPALLLTLGTAGLQQIMGETSAAFAALVTIVFSILAFVAVASWMRLTLVLPARAVDERFGLKHAWRIGRGQGWRLVVINILTTLISFFVAMIAAIPLVLALYVPAALIWGFTTEASLFVGSLSQVFLGYPITALFVGVLSIAFLTVSGWVPSAQDTGPPAPA